jgi:hypothetical protein
MTALFVCGDARPLFSSNYPVDMDCDHTQAVLAEVIGRVGLYNTTPWFLAADAGGIWPTNLMVNA